MFKTILSKIINIVFGLSLNYLLKLLNFVVIFRVGNAIGDHVYMSNIIREINIKTKKKILLFTNYYELFFNNPRVYKLFKFGLNSYIWFFLKSVKGFNILEFNSIHTKKQKKKHFLYFHKNNSIHICKAASEHFNMNLNDPNIKNEFYFSEEEKKNFDTSMDLPKKFSLIQSTTKKTFTSNKDWKVEGLQKVVSYFKNINWIQIGTSRDPRLNGCTIFFDQNLRKLAYLIYRCEFLVTYEGLFNHLANCFKKKNFLIHTGFLHLNSINYLNNIVIENNNFMDCYPCFTLHCETHKKKFAHGLKESQVIEIIEKNLN